MRYAPSVEANKGASKAKTVALTLSEIGLIATTSALIGASVGLLAAGSLSGERRRTIGWILAGIGLAYLDVWQRNITAVEDPCLREAALGGPDTTPRS